MPRGTAKRRIALGVAAGLLLIPLGVGALVQHVLHSLEPEPASSPPVGSLPAPPVWEPAADAPAVPPVEPARPLPEHAFGDLGADRPSAPRAEIAMDHFADSDPGWDDEPVADLLELVPAAVDEAEDAPDPLVFASVPVGVAPVRVATGMASPIFATGMPGDPRLFVVERAGRIRIVEDGVIRAIPFLDIRSRVGTAGEGGLLGLAFDPDHAFNGLFYLFYTDTAGDTVLSRFELGSNPNRADAGTEEILLAVMQPFQNHNGGTIAFRPGEDCCIYVGLGDGGSGNDPDERAQNAQDLLGKMLRLDVSGGVGTSYAIPADNPFALDPNVLSEIWALGLRNPFRFAFDWQTGDLWIADVGQSSREEINFEPGMDPGGRNYGWDVREGTVTAPLADQAQLPYVNAPPFVDPIYDYDHTMGNCSITGGSVYRGTLATIQGEYFFGDYCTGRIWSLDRSTVPVTIFDRSLELAPAAGVPFALAAIGEGGFGALYVVLLTGDVYRIGPTGTECADGIDNDGDGDMDFPADTGCDAANDPSELDSDTPCDDGYDNNADGTIDFPDDTVCLSADSSAEVPVTGGGGGGGGGSCGLGFELAFLLPPLVWLYSRRRRAIH